MVPESAAEAAKPGWFRLLFDRGHLRGVGTTLGVVCGLPFGVVFGLILGGDWAHQATDSADLARYGGLLLALIGCLGVGGVVGSGVGGLLAAAGVRDGGGSRAVVGGVTGAVVFAAAATALAVLLQDAANLRSWAAAGLIGGATLGVILGWALRPTTARKVG